MKSLKMLVALAVIVGIAGCDTNAFTEDFPDPATEGLPPYVALDAGQLTTGGWAYSDALADQGSRRTIAHPGTGTAATALTGLRVRLPIAIGEDVRVTFETGGTAVRGTDYRIDIFDAEQTACVSPFNMAACWVPLTGNELTIRYQDENWPAAGQAPHYRDLRIVTLPNPASTAPRTVQIRLTGATALQTGRTITIGRFPNLRDELVTLTISAPVALTGVTIACPAELEVDETGTFRVATLTPATPTGPLTYTWNFGDGGATATGATVERAYTQVGTYTVTVTARSLISEVQRTCEVVVVEPEDEDEDDE
jgi:hypothetical protein